MLLTEMKIELIQFIMQHMMRGIRVGFQKVSKKLLDLMLSPIICLGEAFLSALVSKLDSMVIIAVTKNGLMLMPQNWEITRKFRNRVME